MHSPRLNSEDISVIIPVFNRDQFLAESIASVQNQTQAVGETIVIDDGSHHRFASVIAEICRQTNVKLIRVTQNTGVSAARNLGIQLAKGTWIALLDSDDTWEPDKIASQIRFINQNPQFRIMQSQERWLRNGRSIKPKKHHIKPSGNIWQRSLELCLVSPSAVLMEKSLVEEVGLFDERMRSCEDYDLWLRISRHHIVGLDDETVVIKQGGHPDQLSAAYDRIDDFRIYSLIKNALSELCPAHKQSLILQALKKIQLIRNGAIKRNKPTDDLDAFESWVQGDQLKRAYTWLISRLDEKKLR